MSVIHSRAWWNGRVVATGDIRLSPFQTGLLTGWGLFSTLRLYRGVPFALEDHVARLEHDAACLRMAVPGLGAELAAAFAALTSPGAGDPPVREAMARVYCIRNRGGLFDQPNERPTDVLVFTGELRAWGDSAKLRLQPFGRLAAGPMAGTKTLTWSHNLVMVEEANAAGFDDVLLLNERGEVAECTAANVFVARGGRVRTPPLDSGALPGVSRKALLQAAAAEGWPIEEATLRAADLEAADEIFITSSTREVQPVTRIGDRDYAPGPAAARAAAVFRRAVDAYVAGRTAPEGAAAR